MKLITHLPSSNFNFLNQMLRLLALLKHILDPIPDVCSHPCRWENVSKGERSFSPPPPPISTSPEAKCNSSKMTRGVGGILLRRFPVFLIFRLQDVVSPSAEEARLTSFEM